MAHIDTSEILNSRAWAVDISGPLDSSGAADFEKSIDTLMAAGHRSFVINVGQVEYVSSEGIGVLAKKHRVISDAGGIMTLFGLSAEVMRLFRVFGLDREMNLADSRISAMEIIDRALEADYDTSAQDRVAKGGGSSTDEYAVKSKVSRFDTFISECASCGTLLRVSSPGDFKCPDCSALFNVSQSGNVEF